MEGVLKKTRMVYLRLDSSTSTSVVETLPPLLASLANSKSMVCALLGDDACVRVPGVVLELLSYTHKT